MFVLRDRLLQDRGPKTCIYLLGLVWGCDSGFPSLCRRLASRDDDICYDICGPSLVLCKDKTGKTTCRGLKCTGSACGDRVLNCHSTVNGHFSHQSNHVHARLSGIGWGRWRVACWSSLCGTSLACLWAPLGGYIRESRQARLAMRLRLGAFSSLLHRFH